MLEVYFEKFCEINFGLDVIKKKKEPKITTLKFWNYSRRI